MKNLNFINHENGSEGLKNQGLTGLRAGVKSRIGTRSLRNTLLPVLIGTLLLTLGVGQMWGAAKQRYIYCGISNNYDTYKDGSNWGFNFWGGTSAGVKSVTYIQDDYHDGRNYKVFRVQVYDDNNKAQFKGNSSWWVPDGGYSCTLNGTTNNAVYFSASEDGWYGQFQKNFIETSTASLSASSTSVAIGTTVTLTPSLASNQDYNEIKSTSYSVTTNPNSGGSVTSAGVFSATKAGSYTVTATVTYNAKDFSGITQTTTATKTITVYATVTFDKEGGSGGNDTQNATYNTATSSITAPTKTNYDFGGYYDGDNGTGNQIINASGVWQKNKSGFTDNSATPKWIILTNVTLYAKWTPKTYTITYKDQGNVSYSGSNEASLPSSYTYGTGVALVDGVKSGYRFDGWFTTSACTGDPVTSISSSATGAKTFYAKWTENPGGTVTLTAGTGGQVSKNGSSWSSSASYTGIKTTDALNIYAQANDGYVFSSWTRTSGTGTIASTSSASTTYTPVANADAELTANFAAKTNALSVSSSTLYAGDNITLSATRTNHSLNLTYQYKIGSGSWTDIATQSGTSKTWQIPYANTYQTYKFRVKSTDGSVDIISSEQTVNVKGRIIIHVKNTNSWASLYLYSWYSTSTTTNGAWPGSTGSGSNGQNCSIHATGSLWWDVTITQTTTNAQKFILNCKTSGDQNQTADLNLSSFTHDAYYAMSTNGSAVQTLSTTTTPAAPTATTNDANNITSTSVVFNYTVSANRDKTTPGIAFVQSDGDVDATTIYSSGTKVPGSAILDGNASGSTAAQTITPGKKYYYVAYGTNGFGTSYGTVKSFVAPYKVTITKPTGCSAITPGAGTQYVHIGDEISSTAVTGYTFSSWSLSNVTLSSPTTTTGVTTSTITAISADNGTIQPVYTENMTTVNLIASPAGKGTFTIGGAAATSTTAGVTTTRSVTAVPATGYRVNTSTTVWSKNNENITLNNVNANPVTVTGAGSGGTSTLTATFTPITYSIHFNGNGNTSGSMSNQTGVTYDAATTITANAFGRTGYNFAGWATTQERANAGIVDRTDGAAHGNLASTQGATAQLWAVWTAKTTTISYSQSGTGYGSGGQVATKTATYDAAMPTPISTPTAANGYAFMGYYDALEPLGTKYYNANGTSARTWNKEDAAVTLYAYFKKAEITALTLDATVVEINGTVGVTPTISPTPTGDYKLCFYVFHGNDNPLDPQPEITWNGTKATFSAGATSGTFKIGVSLRTGSSCGGGTLLDSTTVSYQVAGVHTVTVRYKCGDDVIKASTSLEGIRPLDWSADITAPAITGYSFTEWEAGDGVTIKDAAGSDKTTSTYQTIKIKAVYDGYLTAKYSKKRVIYFNNTLNWANVYVYFYNSNGYWNDSKGVGSRTGGAYSGIHGQMQPIEEGSKIYYFDAEAAGVNSSWTHVAFTELEQTNYEFFAQTASKNNKVAYRGDYYATKLPMFVPLDVSESKNSGLADYYNKGYWMNYPENTGYTLKIYNQKATSGAVELKSIPFEFAENKAMPMELNVDLEAGQTYGFKIYRNDGLNTGAGSFYGNTGTMTANTEGWDMTTDASTNTGLQTTAAGSYKFLLNYYAVSSNYQYRVSVTYPVASGDYRLLYKDDVHTAWHPSAVVAKANAKDTVSFFVRTGKHAYLKLQKCTGLGAGTVTWKDTVTWWNNGSGIPAAVTQDSVYNICLKHNASNGKLEIEKVEAYTGNYYIRVDAANSKWDNYRTDPDHLMTYSEYSIKHGGYSHYYCHWVKTDDRKNIKFVIANDYSPCISDTLVRETASGEWENIGTFIESNGDIKCNANVRFMWYQHDNTIKRAYVDGAQEDGSEFLLMLNTDATAKIKWADGTALTDKKVTFSDNGNWIYEANVQAQPNAKIRLKSTWGEGTTIVQYFKGSSSTSEDLIGGSGTDWYPIRVLYDFKTNRIVASYVPATGTINSDVQINADVMFIREHQGDIAQLTFGVSGSISKIETAYGVLRFNKWTINNKDKSTHSPLASPKSRYERDLFYVSFPFRVSLEEVFGFGTYGKHWIVEYYDGAARAANGFWAETPTFWRFYTNRKGVFLEPNQGYILALDLDNLGESSDVWANTENVELYFPSYGSMPTITSSSVTHELPEHECTINRPTPDGNRTIKDSHWNIMSVPTYVNTNNVTFANDTWTASKPSFLYTWNMDDNSLTATSGKGYTYKAMHAYTVQYCGDVTWTTSVSPSSIVAHRTYAEAPSEVEFCLELQQNENMIDRTFVRMSNDADVDAEFVFGEDMSKDFNRNKANIYTKVTTLMDDELTVTEVAGNCLPMSEQTTVVPMGIMTPNAGTYTIAIPSGTSGVGVTLIDNETGIRTNLALMDYTVDLDAGTYDDRFVLEISPMKHLTTDIEGVDDGQDEKIRKVLIDQQMYIIKDKTVFDARGARVK